MNAFLVAFAPYFPWIILLVVLLMFRRSIVRLVEAIRNRLFKARSMSWEGSHLGKVMIVCTEDIPAQDDDLKKHGNPDQLRLMFKVQSETWVKSTKAMNVPGGCLVQMSTDRKQRNGSWVSAETSTFLPNAHVVPDENGNFTIRAVEQHKSDNKRDPEIRASLWMV
jgi:hypothetical protein